MRGFLKALPSIVTLFATAATRADNVTVTALVSDQFAIGSTPADPDLINPWGVSSSPTGPLWISNNGMGVATIYSLSATNVPTKSGLRVTIPGDGTLTGQVNTTGGLLSPFNNDNFLFVNEDGTISGWRGALGTNAEVLKTADTANVYKGSAFANTGGHSYLYSANFRAGTIDVLKGDTTAPSLTGSFTDPNLTAGFAPFNIQNLGGKLYVTYALQDPTKHDDVPGMGNGFVNAFDLNGILLGRVATHGTLNSPWGLAIAPSAWGPLAGDLLVGNFGDGRINIFDPSNNFLGQLNDTTGKPVSIDGLWALNVGNGGSGGNRGQIYFTAGPSDEMHGLFGVISIPEASPALLAVEAGAIGLGLWQARRRLTRPAAA
jgi:uncharacterized protein (TIGR03118 family)